MDPLPLIDELHSSPIIHRYAGNPVLQASDVPYNAGLIFNAGVCKYQGRYVMVFRNDYGSLEEQRIDGTNLGLAFSDDGIHWQVEPRPCLAMRDEEILRVYDPRLVVLEGVVYLCFALDTRHGVRAGIASTGDFYHYEILTLTVPDNRNIVLFPERIGGKYHRLERPFPVYSRGGERFDIWYSDSPDLRYWGDERLVLAVEQVPYANTKIGPAAPPLRTDRGWLTTFHAVDTDPSRGKNGWEAAWRKRYTMGVMLLDLDEPWKVIGMSREPVLVPEAEYEVSGGFRNNAVFPCGAILEHNGEVRIYYGAADTVTCLATAQVDDLLDLCVPLTN
ncbi:MAG: glycosidase [Chloroflexi bacterium]|nr:glycosidase [Chloroflexota bacterium]